jgi:hypothetical protein
MTRCNEVQRGITRSKHCNFSPDEGLETLGQCANAGGVQLVRWVGTAILASTKALNHSPSDRECKPQINGKQRTWLTLMLHRVSYRGANKDPPGYFCLIFDLKKIDFSTSR